MKRSLAPLSYVAQLTPWEVGNASRGSRYTVITSFSDADDHSHPVGETWVFVGAGFDKFEETVWLGVRTHEGADWLIPLCWRDARQANVLDRWMKFVRVSKDG